MVPRQIDTLKKLVRRTTPDWFAIGGRIFYSLLALTAPYLLWWAITWNLLGFQF